MLHVSQCLSSRKCGTTSALVFLTDYVPYWAAADSQANSYLGSVCKVFYSFLKGEVQLCTGVSSVHEEVSLEIILLTNKFMILAEIIAKG